MALCTKSADCSATQHSKLYRLQCMLSTDFAFDCHWAYTCRIYIQTVMCVCTQFACSMSSALPCDIDVSNATSLRTKTPQRTRYLYHIIGL